MVRTWFYLWISVIAAQQIPNHLITVPKEIWSGEHFEYCVTFPKASSPETGNVEIQISLQYRDGTQNISQEYDKVQYVQVSDVSKCEQLLAPAQSGRWKIIVKMETMKTDGNQPNTTYKSDITVHDSSSRGVTLIQTDKPMYKPGQIVKFRIMRLKKDFTAMTEKIPWVYVENPSGVRIRQWKNVENSKGISSLEMELSSDPPLGTWVIKAEYRDRKTFTQTFEVKEYVLPKFEVKITPPSYLLPTSPTIDAEVCASYTYGKKVKGQLAVTFCYNSRHYFSHWRSRGNQFDRPCTERYLKIDGCAKVSVNTSEIRLSSTAYSLYGYLRINATVTEAGTGIVLHGKSSGPEVKRQPFDLKITDNTYNFFKKAFPYQGKVKATRPDGSSAAGELITVRTSEVTSGVRFHKNFTTDSNGEIQFSVEGIPDNLTSLSISAFAPMYKNEYRRSQTHTLWQPMTSVFVRRWFSPSNSFMEVKKVKQPVECGKDSDLDVLFTATPGTSYRFHIMVMSNGRNVFTSQKTYQFMAENAVSMSSADSSTVLDKFILPSPPSPPSIPEIRPPLPEIEPLLPEILEDVTSSLSNTSSVSNDTKGDATSGKKTKPNKEPRTREKRSGRLPCRDDKGNLVKDGDMFAPNKSDPCTSCICEQGQRGACSVIFCDAPPCPNYILIEGTCCGFECLDAGTPGNKLSKECVDHQGKLVKNGEMFTPNGSDPCRNCVCENGEMGICNTVFCSPPPCPNYRLIEGTCCGFECLENLEKKKGCLDHKGKLVKDGEMFTPNRSDPCRNCVCENGRKGICNTVFCSPPPCPNYRLIEGTCCGFECLENLEKKKDCVDHKGDTIQDGNMFSPNGSDPCNMCMCDRGEKGYCNLVFCDEPPCRNYELIDGTCCGFVCPDEKVARSNEENYFGSVRFGIPVNAAMAPQSKVIVYYIRDDGETVATSVSIEVEKCFNNKVTMEFLKDSVRPGNNATVRLQGDPDSVCSVGVVDKSMNLLKADHQITPEQVYSLMGSPGHFSYPFWFNNDDYCRQKTGNDLHPGKRFDRNIVDAMEAFRSMDVVVFSDLKVQTRPCIELPFVYYVDYMESGILLGGGPVAVARKLGNEVPASVQKEEKRIRNFFPETWLWEIDMIGKTGKEVFKRKIPDTITEWQGNAVCLNPTSGIGISPVVGVKSFQPFFLSFTLPYSAVRNENVPVMVTVFNYMSECLVMKIKLASSSDFQLEGYARQTQIICICGGESYTYRILIKPLTLGKISLKAEAESIKDNRTCGTKTVSTEGTGVYDGVTRELLIEAEGIEEDLTYSSYMCPTGSPGLTQTENITIKVPKDIVPDSERGMINIIGDVMGPALSNLKDLLRMPYGCGEQNMASFAPNIFVLRYFYNTNQNVDAIVQDAKRFMRVGYQRQLKYRHPDGSYSAWGGGEGTSGSMWLTAFVVKCLGQARQYIDVDERDLMTSISWFRRQQNEIGCFPKVGYTHSYYLKGGWGKGNDSEGTMTAFVMIAMLEAGIPKNDSAVLGALRCLDLQEVKDTYMLTVMAYAYSLYDTKSIRRLEIMRLLRSKLKRKGADMVYWERDIDVDKTSKSRPTWYRAPSAEVEMTSYALLAYIVGDQPEAVINAKPIVMWLSKQRNSQGGFSSTQDTIVALQALSIYGTLIHQGGTDLTVGINGEKMSTAIGISDENKLVLHSRKIEKIPNVLTFTVKGVGCALLQANVKYNMPRRAPRKDFKIKFNAHRSENDINNCARRTLSTCVRYTGDSVKTQMAIVDIKMQTGWVPVKETLTNMMQNSSETAEGLQKYEIDGNIVHIYFDYLDQFTRCFDFDVEQDIELSDPKPAYVKVYDYYETGSSVTTTYDIKTICGTKDELPFLTPEEYEATLSRPPGMITQVRVPGSLFSVKSLKPGPPGEQICPSCIENSDRNSTNLTEIVCGAKHIFKGRTSKNPNVKFPLKLYADMKPSKKTIISKFVRIEMFRNCKCSYLQSSDTKLMIFTGKGSYSATDRKLNLKMTSTVLKWTKDFEKRVFQKNKSC